MDISKDVCTYYTIHGLEDNYGKQILETGLGGLMRNCLNFIEEETLLQTNSCKMVEHIDHIIVNRTPRITQCLHWKYWGGTWGCGWQENGLYALPSCKNWFEVVSPPQ